jgi:lipopolysaccharide transport system ATP-binding protein
MDAIRRLCNRGLLLQNGTIEYSGNIIDTLEHYIIRNDNASKKIYNKNVTDSIYLEEAVFYGDKDIPKHELFINESWKIKIRFGVTEVTQDTIFAIGLISSSELPINTTWSQPENFKPGNYEIEFVSDKVFFQKGVYKVVFGISKGKESLFYDEKFLQFEVLLVSKELNQNIISVDGSTGIILNQLQMKINQL